jgi:hypothetical protein
MECGIIPSFPSDIPLATDNTSPTALTINVLTPKNFLITNPDKMVLTSGIPLPAAVYRTLTSPCWESGSGYIDFVRRVKSEDRVLKRIATAM